MLTESDTEEVEESETEGAALCVDCEERDTLPHCEILDEPLGDGVEALEGGTVGPNVGTLVGETDNDASPVGVSGRETHDAAADCDAELVADRLTVNETVPHVDAVGVSDMLVDGAVEGDKERMEVVVPDAA